ncbi:hypothetical protein PK28_00110 [Hymenobacter sp. DG25B]|uniref:PAS domain-containing protein n=1 Tax=Hymenobacter sp. DG25B TaxID=1385664 RepID=UPI000540E1E5|nr:PAS domain-containing sensor histidine kinase [Hymenobacter sp. DG25B]AIZ62494.1 hypothetical protein PK28_00110 [Hymenobacter sp. DG25B]
MQPITYRHLRRKLQQATHLYTATRTEAQQLHKQLAQQQVAAASLSATLLQTVTTAVLAENDQQQITLLNQRFCDLFGLPESPQSYVGQLQTQVYTQAAHALLHSPATQHSTTQAVAQQQPLRDVVIPLSNGLIVKQQYLPVVLEGHTLLHLWSYEDVTAQQCAQRRIEELSRLAEQSPHPIICFNSRGEAQYTNPAGRAVLDVLTDQSDNMAFLQREIARALHEGQACVSEWPLQQQLYLWTVVPLAGENCANVYLTDLTGQRRAERDLLRGQLFTNRINDTVPNLVYLYDLEEGRLLYANQQSLPLLGYTPAELQEMSTNLLSMLMREEDAALVKKQIQATGALADGETLLNEYHIRHRDGSSRWLRTRTVAFTCYPNGQVRQLVGSAEDVTAQRTIAEELRHNRLLLERIINTAPNLIYIFDLEESRSVYCNHHTEIILGYTSEEIVGMGPAMMQQLIPPKQRRLLQQHWNQLVQAADGDVFTLEYHMPHRDGSSRWLRIRSTPFERDATGRVKLVVGSAEDITPWKLAEKQQLAAAQRLEEQNRLFRQVIDSTPHLIYLKDHTGRYVLANEATAQLHSMSLPELLAASPEELHPIPEQRRKYLFQDQQVISTGQELRAEKEFTRPNGQPVWLYTIKRPFVLADGSVQVLGIDSNITNLKQTQLALNEAKENAEKTARAKQDFLANMSHEIRTPMHGILGIAGLLAKTKLTTSQQEYLQHIRESAEHLLVVINDILAITQLGPVRSK